MISAVVVMFGVKNGIERLSKFLISVVAFITCVLIGWYTKPGYIEEEVLISAGKFRSRKLHSVMLRYICPICMIIILLTPFIMDI